MNDRKIDQKEFIDIIVEVSNTLSGKLGELSVILPKLLAAGLKFYQVLVEKEQLSEDDMNSRDVTEDMLLTEMEKRV